MAFVLGLNAKTYQNTGTYGRSTWTLRGNVRDVTINLELATADVTHAVAAATAGRSAPWPRARSTSR